MKTSIIKLLPVCLGLMLLGCTAGIPDDDRSDQQEKGQPVELSFKMYEADITKAIGATPVVDLESGTKFTVLAYEAGTAVDPATGKLPEPLGKSVCTIENDKTANGNMSLYRGEYDIYFISYNSEIAPDPSAGAITVDNGHDFMYNEIKGLVVQPQNDGENNMEVTMTGPFVRLGSKVELSVNARANSPVTVTDLKVKSIEIKNLSSPLTYNIGEKDWQPNTGYAGSYTVTDFSYTVNSPLLPHENKDAVVLPVSGSEPLEFNITLDVTYAESGVADLQTKTFTYVAKTSKALLKGMKYRFVFSLTFFGVLNPGEITITLLDYTNIEQSTDNVGE